MAKPPLSKKDMLEKVQGLIQRTLTSSIGLPLTEELLLQVQQTVAQTLIQQDPAGLGLKVEVRRNPTEPSHLLLNFRHPEMDEPIALEVYTHWLADIRLGLNPVPFPQYYRAVKELLES